MGELDLIIRVESMTRIIVEWPDRVTDSVHKAAREVLAGVHGVDGVASTVYREVVQIAPHVAVAEVVAQEAANALLDDSGAFYRAWRAYGYSDISVQVRRW